MLYVTIPLRGSLTQIAYGPGSLGTLIGNVVGFAIVIGAVLTLLWLVLGGIEWITAGGDKSKVEQARDRITQALIGFVIVMASWAIWSLVTRNFFGLDLTSGSTNSATSTCLCDNWAPCGQTHTNTDPNAPGKYCRQFRCDPPGTWTDVGPATGANHPACAGQNQ